VHESLRPNGSASPEETHVDGEVASACIFQAERFEKALRFLKEARFGALVSHLFAIRAFFPTTVSGSESLRKALEGERAQLRDALDRLFIKLRLPQYVVAARDIETTPMRRSLLELVNQLRTGASTAPGRSEGEIVLPGKIDTSEAEQLSAQAQNAQLGTALPWHLLAFLMPDGAAPLRAYRSALLAQLGDLESLSPEEFCQALMSQAPVLDAAFEEAIGALTAAV